MLENQGQFKINDLIGEAVENAAARRQQAMDSEMSEIEVSPEEAKELKGGKLAIAIPPIVLGIYLPPDSLSFPTH